MNLEAAAIANPWSSAGRRAADYLALTKPRVVSMVLITTLAGYYLGAGSAIEIATALKLLAGTAVAAGGTLALNQYFERDLDAKMERTRRRPLPGGRLYPAEALTFGVATTIGGFLYLGAAVNWASAGVIAAIAILYLGAYTPLKRVSWVCNIVGSVPGALPPVVGWLAARQTIGAEPVLLFAIMYLWQLPHSLSIARLYRADYEKAGIHLYPPDGGRGNIANSVIVGDSLILIAVSVLPTLLGFAGVIYMAVALFLGAAMLFCGVNLFRTPERSLSARRVLLASLVYLPLVLLVLVIDKA